MYQLAHISDPHIPPGARPRRRELLSKRVVGWTNWRNNRQMIHRREVLDVITGDLLRQAPDQVAVTGDLTVVAARAELEASRLWLESLGQWHDVSLVPGNHDTYTRRAIPATAREWRDYMLGDGAHGEAEAATFPYLRRRGPLAIIGASSAVANAPFMATGRVGERQRGKIAGLLDEARREGLFRVVLIHHPPLRRRNDRIHRLLDAREFSAMLARHGAELVLHGHDHTSSIGWIEGEAAAVPVIGVPSASALAHGSKPAAAYNIYEIAGEPGQWDCRMLVRGFDGAGVNELAAHELWRQGQPRPQTATLEAE